MLIVPILPPRALPRLGSALPGYAGTREHAEGLRRAPVGVLCLRPRRRPARQGPRRRRHLPQGRSAARRRPRRRDPGPASRLRLDRTGDLDRHRPGHHDRSHQRASLPAARRRGAGSWPRLARPPRLPRRRVRDRGHRRRRDRAQPARRVGCRSALPAPARARARHRSRRARRRSRTGPEVREQQAARRGAVGRAARRDLRRSEARRPGEHACSTCRTSA